MAHMNTWLTVNVDRASNVSFAQFGLFMVFTGRIL